ncbi:MAG: hypothetical protein Kow00111_25770 [Thermincola ferriacetica]
MSNITISVEIKAPELAEAIITLASALAIGKNSKNPNLQKPVEPLTQTPAPTAQTKTAPPEPATAPEPTAAPQPAPAATPTAAPIAPPAQAPAALVPEAQTGAVPTTTPTYTIEQLAVAATQLVDAGRREELVQLLQQFGVQALTALPKEQYGAFATGLRQLGAKI